MFINLWFSVSAFASLPFYVIASFSFRSHRPHFLELILQMVQCSFDASHFLLFLSVLILLLPLCIIFHFYIYIAPIFFLHFTYFLRILTTSKKYKSQICEKSSFFGSSVSSAFSSSRSFGVHCFALEGCLYS